MDYETICKYVGQFFLETRHAIASLEQKSGQLTLEVASLKKQIAELQYGKQEKRDNS